MVYLNHVSAANCPLHYHVNLHSPPWNYLCSSRTIGAVSRLPLFPYNPSQEYLSPKRHDINMITGGMYRSVTNMSACNYVDEQMLRADCVIEMIKV